jgi:streptomycin 6-kinase
MNSYLSSACALTGYYMGVMYCDVDDYRAIVRQYVDEEGLRAAFSAADEIELWLSLDLSDEAFIAFYEEMELQAAGPRDGRLRKYLESVRVCLLTYADSQLRRAFAEHPDLPPQHVLNRMMLAPHGETLLRRLPAQLDTAAKRWGLVVGEPYDSPWTYDARATTESGEAVVVRVGRGADVCSTSLRIYQGDGAVRLLDYVLSEYGTEIEPMLLFEQAIPGQPLSGLVPTDDERATDIFANVLEVLWRPVPPRPPGNDPAPNWGWFSRAGVTNVFEGYAEAYSFKNSLPADLVVDAARVMDELVASATQEVLLHANLVHDRILSSDRSSVGWLAVNPWPVRGEPAYDLGELFFNPVPWVREVVDLDTLVRRRASQVSARLGLDQERVKAWAFVRAVMAEVRSVEETGEPNGVPLRVATALRRMI